MPRAWGWLSYEPQGALGTPPAGTAVPGLPWQSRPMLMAQPWRGGVGEGAGPTAPLAPKQWVGAEGAPRKPTGQDGHSSALLSWMHVLMATAPRREGDMWARGASLREGLSRNASCHLVPFPATTPHSGE